MSEHQDPKHGSTPGEYGPTYYAPLELPLPRLPRPPFWMISFALISIVATWLPLALIARARESTTTSPRIHIIQDMGIQPKFREQMTNPLFADDRAMRPRIPGTVAQNDLDVDANFDHGFTRGADGKPVFASIPAQFTQSPEALQALMHRGQQRFNIYCYVCHGYDGSGRGPVNQRALELKADDPDNNFGISWTQAQNLTVDTIRAEPDGKIFNTITNGIRSMPSYASQIPPEDRWAIVAYVRALQLSQNAPMSILTPEQQSALQGK
jgi:mono/diheme cytochrome c family protein